MAKAKKSRILLARLVSMAQTGYFYTFKRPRAAKPLGLMKYDPIGMIKPPDPRRLIHVRLTLGSAQKGSLLGNEKPIKIRDISRSTKWHHGRAGDPHAIERSALNGKKNLCITMIEMFGVWE